MTKNTEIELLTLKALAARESVTHEYLRKVTAQFKAGKIQEWRGWRFISPGLNERNFWLAFQGTHQIRISDSN